MNDLPRKFIRSALWVVGLALAAVGIVSACAPENHEIVEVTPQPGALFVNTLKPLGKINPFVYGANHGPWAFVNLDLWDEATDSGITFLRFPGGNWGDQNDLRPEHINGFLDLARMIGAEPQISVRLRGGTPEQAAELVRYANIEKGYNIRYWSIGNEPILYVGRENYEDFDSERFNREWRAIAEAMLAVDPNILLLGPEITQYTGAPLPDRNGVDWMRAFFEANGDLVSIASIHRYPFPKSMTSGLASIPDMRANPAEWERIIPALRALILETTGRELPIAVTEVNSHWSNTGGGETSPDSFYNAIWWADVLGRLIKQRVEIVAYFSLQSNDSIGGYGILGRRDVRPTYYVYQLYKQLGQTLLESSSGIPDVSILAAHKADGSLTLMVINLGDNPVSTPVQIHGFDLPATAQAWRFDQEHNAELLDPQTFEPGVPISLPGQSITLYRIP